MLYAVLYMPAVRTQIYLTDGQRRALDERARRENTSMAHVIREAVEEYLKPSEADAEAALEEAFGSLPELDVPSRDEWDRG
jgi:hypothetical protein